LGNGTDPRHEFLLQHWLFRDLQVLICFLMTKQGPVISFSLSHLELIQLLQQFLPAFMARIFVISPDAQDSSAPIPGDDGNAFFIYLVPSPPFLPPRHAAVVLLLSCTRLVFLY
jgi:hypothetical protein